MKQSSIEWLIKEYSKYVDDSNVPFKVIEQAKEMEKEQIMDAYDEGWSDGFNDKDLNAEYYNETFKANEK
jgi:HEPN domain-containing protein